jgi:hypothetical protein
MSQPGLVCYLLTDEHQPFIPPQKLNDELTTRDYLRCNGPGGAVQAHPFSQFNQ